MLNACTIIARNYLPFARVLAESFFSHHPTGTFTVLLTDDEERQFSPGDDRVEWRRLSDIGLDSSEVLRLAGIYDVTELATAVKPLLLRRLLDEGGGAVLYFDPDIRIYAPLEEIGALTAAHGIVLTPHTMRPFPEDERDIDGRFVLGAGVYNLGFIGVTDRARPFLDWWWHMTRRGALNAPAEMMFTDQRWVDFVPSFFDPFILKDPGCNVAYWNLHGRDLALDGDRYVVDGLPLRFFHFSGFDPRKPWLLSKHQGDRPRVLLSERPVLARLCREYLHRLEAAGVNDPGRPPYRWASLTSGVPLTGRIRRLYRDSLVAAEARGGAAPPNPFDRDDPDDFLRWLTSPDERGSRHISRFLWSIYRDRPDVQSRFPDIHGNDVRGFADWVLKFGVQDESIPLELQPDLDAIERSLARTAPAELRREGLNVVGYFRAELGIGEAARHLLAALDATGIPHTTITYDATLSRQSHPFAERTADGPPFDVNVLCVNADSTPQFARAVGPDFFDGRHTVGYWFWEVEALPASMHAAFDVVDEVWAATDFVADAIRRAGDKPVFVIPLPVLVPVYSPDLDRRRLGLRDAFTFLFLFDFLSVVERKNPHGLIEAFTSAFAPNEGPVLVIKTINGQLRLTELERLRAAAAERPDVVVIDDYYTHEQKSALLGASDCYVSLHRSEGLGLTMAEAMALGKPVIATGYSGNLHFMTPENSFLVNYARVHVPPGCEPYPTTVEWAEPDLEQAAALMREVYERPDAAKAVGERARRDILEHHSVDVTGRQVAGRLDAIGRARRQRVAGSEPVRPAIQTTAPPASSSVAVDQLEALLATLPELSALKVGAEGALSGLRLKAQRALFRVLRPLWFQQQQFHTQVIAALRLTVGALRAEQQARDIADARLRELTRRVLSARREVARLASEAGTGERTRALVAALEAELSRLEQRAMAIQSEAIRPRASCDSE